MEGVSPGEERGGVCGGARSESSSQAIPGRGVWCSSALCRGSDCCSSRVHVICYETFFVPDLEGVWRLGWWIWHSIVGFFWLRQVHVGRAELFLSRLIWPRVGWARLCLGPPLRQSPGPFRGVAKLYRIWRAFTIMFAMIFNHTARNYEVWWSVDNQSSFGCVT